jgi:hypothetical protein
MDTFVLTVVVTPDAAINILEDLVNAGNVNHGAVAQTAFTVQNTGNTDIEMIEFNAEDLDITAICGGEEHQIIPADQVTFIPATISGLADGAQVTVYVSINVPVDQRAGDYQGMITALVDNSDATDQTSLTLHVNTDTALDVDEDALDVHSNTMALEDDETGTFMVHNTGNDDITLTYALPTL